MAFLRFAIMFMVLWILLSRKLDFKMLKTWKGCRLCAVVKIKETISLFSFTKHKIVYRQIAELDQHGAAAYSLNDLMYSSIDSYFFL